MFKQDLKDRFKSIFGFPKVTFDAPSEAFEQDTLFIELNECQTRVTDKKVLAKVTGFIVVYAQAERLPFGYFSKRINQADPDLTRDLFFYDIDINVEKNRAMFQNLVERRTRFVFLYSEQYDPNKGELTSLSFGS